MQKILFLTQYFPPEVGAPQNRLFELAKRLQKKGMDVSILTAMPNYPQMIIEKGYENKLYCYEEIDNLKIHRCYIFVKKSKSLVLRLLNYFSFVFSSLIIGIYKTQRFDIIFCESPPLFLGITGIILTKIKKAKLIFNVSDLWPESAEKLGLIRNKFLLNITSKLEEYIYKNAFIITGQTQGIVENISKRFIQKKVYWLKNGVDINSFNNIKADNSWRDKNNYKKNDFICFYAGILGYAQGLEVILYAAEKLKDNPNIKFLIFGDGPEKMELTLLKDKLKLNNVFFYQPVPKTEISMIIKSVNAAIIPLKKIELFKGAIPSKIFEILASGKPILLGVDGEAKELFINEGECGLYFEPENSDVLSDKIMELFESKELCLQLGINGKNYVENNFNSDIIAEDFVKLLTHSSQQK